MYYLRNSARKQNLTTDIGNIVLPTINNVIMDLDTGRLVKEGHISIFDCENAYDIKKHEIGFCSYSLHNYTLKKYAIDCSQDCMIVLDATDIIVWYKGYAYSNTALTEYKGLGTMQMVHDGNRKTVLRRSVLHYADGSLRCLSDQGFVREVELFGAIKEMSKAQFKRMVLL